MTGERVCLVVPCAGFGHRLRLPWPKELMALGPDRTLIDAALAPFLDAAGPEPRVVAVLRAHKLDTLRHLLRYQRRAELVAVFQPGDGDRLADALRAALPFTTDRNALVLPDQLLGTDEAAVACVRDGYAVLRREPVAVLSYRMGGEALAAEGALRTADDGDGPRAVAWRDKPQRPERFDAAWAAVLFDRASGSGVADALDALAGGAELADPTSALVGAPVVGAPRYVNVSTWEAVTRVLSDPEVWR
jgi:hypothetical protein